MKRDFRMLLVVGASLVTIAGADAATQQAHRPAPLICQIWPERYFELGTQNGDPCL